MALCPAMSRVVIEIDSQALSLIPGHICDATGRALSSLTSVSLLEESVAGPSFGRVHDVSSNRLQWAIRVRPGAVWSTGAPITARDWAESISAQLQYPKHYPISWLVS